MKLPRNITQAQAARRALLADLAIAFVLAILALSIAAGIGVVGFLALLVLLAVLAWIALEATVRALLRRRSRGLRSSSRVVNGNPQRLRRRT